MFNPFSAVRRLFRKSTGEKKLLAMLNSNTSAITGNLWNTKRPEYVNHVTGWNYIAIDAIASEVAGMTPHYAYQVDNADQRSVKKAIMNRVIGYTKGRYLTHAERRKALTGLQEQVELESVSSEHPLIRLNARPNPIDVAWTYWYKVILFLRSVGEAYIWDVPNGNGTPKESWVIPAHWVWPRHGPDKMIGSYDIKPISTWTPDSDVGNLFWFGGGGGQFNIPADQIMPFFMPSPHSMVGGYSPLGACSSWTDCSDNVDRSRVFKFQNDAFPSVAVVFDKEIDPDTIKQPDIDRLKAMIKEKYTGVRRTGEPAILGPGMSLQILSATPRDMDYTEGFAQLRDSLMACHRTGPIVAGLGNETTHAAGKAVRAGWHSSTITPLVKMMGQVVTEHRCRKFDEGLVCFWMDSAPEDIEFEQLQRKDFLDRGVITLNEARAQAGLPPHPNEEIGNMTFPELKAYTSVPKGLGSGAPSDSLGEELDASGASTSRMDQIFQPSRNGNGNGNGSMLNGNDNMKALLDLRRELLISE